MTLTTQSLAEARGHAEAVLAFLNSVEAQAPVVEVPAATALAVGLQNPAAFYEYIRGDAGELFPSMNQSQLEGIEALLSFAAGRLPLAWCAYCLATDYHETNKTMQAVREAYWTSEEWRRKNLKYFPWYGRGLVQLTWEANYKLATEKLAEHDYDVDLIAKPDDALRLGVAVAVMVYGMLEGWFTSKKLRDYIPAEAERKHYVNARRIINGTDKADLIAGYAVTFQQALEKGDWQ